MLAGPNHNDNGAIGMANAILSDRATQRMLRHRGAVVTLALFRAKNAVKGQLHAQGIKLASVSARELHYLADDYLDQHRARLIAEAEEAIATSPYFARWRLPVAKLSSDAQTTSEPKSITSVVQNSGAEWRADQ
jgi:hypothetical protein